MFIILSRWRLFKKMGYKGWVFLVPFYNRFCMFEALYGNGWRYFQPLWVIPLILSVSVLFSVIAKETILIVIGLIIVTIYEIYFNLSFIMRLTHSFGKSGWWTLGTLLFFPAFLIVYGISDLCFMDYPYPDEDNYDAVDGFVEFFRSRSWRNNNSSINNNQKRFCPNCGLPVSSDASFCSECGTPIED